MTKQLVYICGDDISAIYLDGKVVTDYDDYVNLECAEYLLKALEIDFETTGYYIPREVYDTTNGFPQDLTENFIAQLLPD